MVFSFVGRDVFLRVWNAYTIFTQEYEANAVVRIPVAHHDGNYFADDATVAALEDHNRVAFRYCDAAGNPTSDANPNGSAANIAGIVNEAGNVLGMMPHPERLADAALGGTDGKRMFDALAPNLAASIRGSSGVDLSLLTLSRFPRHTLRKPRWQP